MLTRRLRPGKLVTDPNEAAYKKKVWKEILEILRGVDPELGTEY